MEIVLERRGGVTGVRRTVRLAGAALGAEDVARLRGAVELARFFGSPAELRAARAGPDRFAYRLAIEDGGRRHAISFDEDAASEELLALVAEVEDVAERTAGG